MLKKQKFINFKEPKKLPFGIKEFVSERALSRSSAERLRRELLGKGLTESQFYEQAQNKTASLLRKTPDSANFRDASEFLSGCELIEKPADDRCLGVILETRKHPLLERVVVDFVEKTNCRVQLFHGRLNLEFIKDGRIGHLIDSGKVVLSPLNVDHINGSIYNEIFLTKSFWQSLIANNKIFVFQTDSLLCPQSDYQLNDFLKYDYVGSWWKRDRPVGLRIDGGNGGLSIRDWTYSINCLNNFAPSKWVGGEDGYFAFYIALLGGNVARGHESGKFGTQHKFLYKSFGCHQISSLSPEDKKKFLDYFPDSALLLK